jgi:hypothetical protein
MSKTEETLATKSPETGARQGRNRIRFSLELTPESYEFLESLVEGTNSTNKSEVLRKAITLMGIAMDAKKSGQKLYISDTPPEGNSREIIGI